MENKKGIHDLDNASFSLYFIEDNIITNVNNSYSTLTEIKIYPYTDKPLILLHVFKKMTAFCNL